MLQQIRAKRAQNEDGFTLIELLIAIVVVGVLSAVVIVGIGSLTNKGESSACEASLDAAQAASLVYYANSPLPSSYPDDFADIVGDELTLDTGTAVNAGDNTIIDGKGWSLDMAGGGAAAPTFTCS
jgi:prepilin-type N-terminal cleavage/methylation domain-containing protein